MTWRACPWFCRNFRSQQRLRQSIAFAHRASEYEQNPRLLEEKPDIFMAMGNTAEVVAKRYNVTRETQDEYAVQSQARYAQAVEAGSIAEEIVPMNAAMMMVDKETGDQSRVEAV